MGSSPKLVPERELLSRLYRKCKPLGTCVQLSAYGIKIKTDRVLLPSPASNKEPFFALPKQRCKCSGVSGVSSRRYGAPNGDISLHRKAPCAVCLAATHKKQGPKDWNLWGTSWKTGKSLYENLCGEARKQGPNSQSTLIFTSAS